MCAGVRDRCAAGTPYRCPKDEATHTRLRTGDSQTCRLSMTRGLSPRFLTPCPTTWPGCYVFTGGSSSRRLASRPTTPARMSSTGQVHRAARPAPCVSSETMAMPAKTTPAMSEMASRSCRGTSHLHPTSTDPGAQHEQAGIGCAGVRHLAPDVQAVPVAPEEIEVTGAGVGVDLDGRAGRNDDIEVTGGDRGDHGERRPVEVEGAEVD